MSNRSYGLTLSEEDKILIRLTTHRGKITFFVIQYTSFINGKWQTIIRADTVHRYAHKHVYHLHSAEYKVKLDLDYSKAFNKVKTEIKTNYLKIKDNFLNT